MLVIDFEVSLRRFDEQLRDLDRLYARIENALAKRELYSPHFDLFSRKSEEAKRRDILLNKVNQLFQLIRFMIKHNYLLKRNRIFQLGEMFNLYRRIRQSRVNELNQVVEERITVERENKPRGELQWQQVFA